MRISRLYFYLPALLWLPLSIIALTLLRGFAIPDQSLGEWLIFFTLGPMGIVLPLACRAIWRQGYKKTTVVLGVILMPLTVLYGLVGGLLGPLGIVVSVLIASLPAWIVYGVLKLIKSKRARRAKVAEA